MPEFAGTSRDAETAPINAGLIGPGGRTMRKRIPMRSILSGGRTDAPSHGSQRKLSGEPEPEVSGNRPEIRGKVKPANRPLDVPRQIKSALHNGNMDEGNSRDGDDDKGEPDQCVPVDEREVGQLGQREVDGEVVGDKRDQRGHARADLGLQASGLEPEGRPRNDGKQPKRHHHSPDIERGTTLDLHFVDKPWIQLLASNMAVRIDPRRRLPEDPVCEKRTVTDQYEFVLDVERQNRFILGGADSNGERLLVERKALELHGGRVLPAYDRPRRDQSFGIDLEDRLDMRPGLFERVLEVYLGGPYPRRI